METTFPYHQYSTEDLIDSLPENRPLYKDSGLWQVRTDDMEEMFICQTANESFREFILRYCKFLEFMAGADTLQLNLLAK